MIDRLFLSLALICATLVAAPIANAASSILTIEPAEPTPQSSCLAFGAGPGGFPDTSPFMGFIYKDIPAFDLVAGDILAFDLSDVNDFDIELDIDMAATTANGDTEEGEPFTKVVTNIQTPTNPRGNTVEGDFDLQFTVENPFSFAGGGLIIRFSNGSPEYQMDDTTCDQVGVVATNTDSSGNFVRAFWNDSDGVFPWAPDPAAIPLANEIIGGFKIIPLTKASLTGDIFRQDGAGPISRTAVGRVIKYRVEAGNSTGADGTGVEVTTSLPPGVEFLGAIATPAAAAVYTPGFPATVVWTVGDLADGAQATLDIDLRVEFSANDSTLIFSAEITAADSPLEAGAVEVSDIDVNDTAWELLADSGNGCFIATAAYGSWLDPEVRVLRRFRDEHLLTNVAGRAFVDWYYRTSPPIASAIRDSEAARWVVRVALTPLVYAIAHPIAFGLVIVIACTGLIGLRRRLEYR